MGNEQATQMQENIGKRVKTYVFIFLILILLQIWGKNMIYLFLNGNFGDDFSKIRTLIEIIGSLCAVIFWIIIFFMNFGRDIDLHNLLDKKIAHVRPKVDQHIYLSMIDASRNVRALGWENMEGKQPEVMRAFYHFVNTQVVLRELAFTYWEQYFVNLYIVVFGIVGLITSIIISIFNWGSKLALIEPVIFLFIIIIVLLSTCYSLIPKLYNLPIQQIKEIKDEDLKAEIERRFGRITIP